MYAAVSVLSPIPRCNCNPTSHRRHQLQKSLRLETWHGCGAGSRGDGAFWGSWHSRREKGLAGGRRGVQGQVLAIAIYRI
jgi:hypothetical protein